MCSILPATGVGNVVKSIYKWVVPFCNGSLNVGDIVVSPVFLTSAQLEWQLRLYPKGANNDVKDRVSIYLTHTNENVVVATATFYLLNSKSEVVKKHTTCTFAYSKGYSFGCDHFAERTFIMDAKNDVLIEDKITILCEIILDMNADVLEQLEENGVKVIKAPECPSRLNVFDDFEKLLENGKFGDVIFSADGQELRVHKGILSSRSVVFNAMFEHDMMEQKENTVEIKDIKYEVLKEVFRYVYAGKVNDIENICKDLIAAADKYALDGLRALCEKKMCESLNDQTALEYLNLADLHNATTLKSQAIKYIVSHAREIIKRPEFKLLYGDLNSDLGREVFCALALK